jgi:hypothetical protein
MVTLLAYYNSEGCIGRCDAKCYNAKTPHCHCICGGRNHGAGLKQAHDNVCQDALTMLKKWLEEHPGANGVNLAACADEFQQALFPEEVT